MGPVVWIVFSLLILGILAFVFTYKKKKNIPPDYRVFFIIGISWIPLGIATENYAFLALGVVFMTLGLRNKSKWKESEVKWIDLPPQARMIRITLIGLGIAFFLAVLLYYFYLGGKPE